MEFNTLATLLDLNGSEIFGSWQMCLSCLSLSHFSNCPSQTLFYLCCSVFRPSSVVKCCAALWPSVSWVCPGHRTARLPTSRPCRTLTKQGWVGSMKKFCIRIDIMPTVSFFLIRNRLENPLEGSQYESLYNTHLICSIESNFIKKNTECMAD